MATKLKIIQIRSQIGSTDSQKATLRSLRLGKINSSTEREENLVVEGMLKKVSHLVRVEKL
ncbi:MAG: 50S ribosomal protein L30 [Bacteroidales bacterium]